jgi:hypothetical protein
LASRKAGLIMVIFALGARIDAHGRDGGETCGWR